MFGADSHITIGDAAERINRQNQKPQRTELVIVSYQYDRDRAKFFRSNPDSARVRIEFEFHRDPGRGGACLHQCADQLFR